MKTLLTSIVLLAGLTIGAQNAEFKITLTMDQNLTGATWTSSTILDLSPYASHFNDVHDTTAPIADYSVAYPFTINSSYTSLRVRDSRPNLYMTRNFAFGVWNTNSGEMHIKGEWLNPNDELLYDVTFIENGFEYDMYNEVSASITADTNYAARFTIRVSPKMHAQAFSASCFNTNDGSIYAKSASPYWGVDVYRDTVLVNSVSVTGMDTLLTGLEQGNYTLVHLFMGEANDTQYVTVASPVQVISSATLSETMPTIGETVNFTNTSTGAATYFWDFGDGNTSTDTSTSHAYNLHWTYTVTLTATNAAGCTDTSTYIVEVGAYSIAGPPVFGNREDENTNDMARTTTTQVQSANNNAALSVKGDAAILQFSVFTMNGQLLYMGSGTNNTFTYGTPGIYLIQVMYTDGSSEAKQWNLN